MRVLLIDNYDSFTYNIVHLLRDCGLTPDKIHVRRNDEIGVDEIANFEAVISSPGPGLPEDSGTLMDCVRNCVERKTPYLGICLGHQALGLALGGRLRRLDRVQHGVQHTCEFERAHPLLEGLTTGFAVGRYHSWIVAANSLDARTQILARSPDDGVVQVLAARDAPAFGVQFHPESIMSPEAGPLIMRNFLRLAAANPPRRTSPSSTPLEHA